MGARAACDTGLRPLAVRAHRHGFFGGGAALLILAAFLVGWHAWRGDHQGAVFTDETGTAEPAPPVVAAPVVYVSLASGADAAAVARQVDVDPTTVRLTAFGFYEFPVRPPTSPEEMERLLRSTAGVVSAGRDRTEEIVLL